MSSFVAFVLVIQSTQPSLPVHAEPSLLPVQVQQRVNARVVLRRAAEAAEAIVQAAYRAEQEKFTAIKQRFETDAGGIIDVLTLWELHGDEFMAWREAQEAAAAQPPPPQATAAPGVPTSPVESQIFLGLPCVSSQVDESPQAVLGTQCSVLDLAPYIKILTLPRGAYPHVCS